MNLSEPMLKLCAPVLCLVISVVVLCEMFLSNLLRKVNKICKGGVAAAGESLIAALGWDTSLDGLGQTAAK